jgi:uncharacterized protein
MLLPEIVRSEIMSDEPKMGASTKRRLLIAVAISAGMLAAVVEPGSAQFFNFDGFEPPPQRSDGWFGGGWFGGDRFRPFHRRAAVPRRARPPPMREDFPRSPPPMREDFSRAPPPTREDFSRAPPPEKRETAPKRQILVLGDGMADWLAYGLEDAYAEQPDIGVIRKTKSTSGLIKYQPKGDPSDWVAAAKAILKTEKPDIVVVMLGLNDRVAMREPITPKNDKPDRKNDKDAHAEGDGKSGSKDGAKADPKPAEVVPKPEVDTELPHDDADKSPPARSPRSPNGPYQFREDHWVELYAKKIEDMIAALKSKGVPTVWVGLPPVSGSKRNSDMLFLDSLYRAAASKAGISYVDIWDGFVDERGLFQEKGPDFEGQIRQLRSDDGIFFTKAGARKLGHYVEREISRLLATRSGPIALPTEPATPDTNGMPGKSAPRPLAGPVVPLTGPSLSTDQLLGGPGTRPAAVDALAMRALIKGEALNPPPGRADDFAWPRREVGSERIKDETPVASASRDRLRGARAQARRRHR